jgi:hypothetical protein
MIPNGQKFTGDPGDGSDWDKSAIKRVFVVFLALAIAGAIAIGQAG